MWRNRRYGSYGVGGYGQQQYGRYGTGDLSGALAQSVWVPLEKAVRLFGQELTMAYRGAQMQLQQEFSRLGASASQMTGGIFVPRGRFGGGRYGGVGGYGGGRYGGVGGYGGGRYGVVGGYGGGRYGRF
jgi:hypothetical protein